MEYPRYLDWWHDFLSTESERDELHELHCLLYGSDYSRWPRPPQLELDL